ncbi:CocE/NonD family hydrolase [Sphingomonas oligophenolica]|uniref:CocE/NonD family hydrolase n=1 Tax=Sphingomonas oligophenolica TaxID=301154 RepID=A0ABU9Y8Q4_9SPHN
MDLFKIGSSLLLILALAQPASAQVSPSVRDSPAQHLIEERGQKVVMRDGVALSVDIVRPDVTAAVPALLSIIPYGKGNDGRSDQARWYAERGYAVILADMRGRFDSDGAWDPFDPRHKNDGYDLVDWVSKQRWNNARVGMFGVSYMGWTQWWTASQAHPALKAIAPIMAPPDPMYNLPYQQGVMKGLFLDVSACLSGRVMQIVGPSPYCGFRQNRSRDLMHTPYLDINRYRGMLDAPWFEKIIRNNLSSSDYFRAIAYQGPDGYAKITVPSLNIAGWFDEDQPGAPLNYVGMKRYGASREGRSPKLIIGPWPHGTTAVRKVGSVDYGPDAPLDSDALSLRWFDHYLKGVDNGIDREPPVSVFVMGANKWYSERDWPLPQTHWTKFFLDSNGHANTSSGDGALLPAPPPNAASDHYVYDPTHPTLSPFAGGNIEDGALDARVPEATSSVLVYTTPPLNEDTEVTGPIQIKLFASTSARDTDWIVHLIDVRPDGYAGLLAEGVMRARNRDPQNAGAFNSAKLSEIIPNRIYEYTIDFWRVTGNLFQKGHRIRVDVQSSYHPYYLRNLNTGADNNGLVDAAGAVVATQTIYHGSRYASYILLPIIPKRAADPR